MKNCFISINQQQKQNKKTERDIKIRTTGFRKKIRGFGFDQKTKKIVDASFQFDMNGQQISIKDYLKKVYNYDLKYEKTKKWNRNIWYWHDSLIKRHSPQLPCIDLGRESYIPMELCLTERKQKKNLTEKQIDDIRVDTVLKAPDRLGKVQEWVNKSGLDRDTVLKAFNINTDLKIQIQSDARVIPAPDIKYGLNKRVDSAHIGEKGAWMHPNYEFIRPSRLFSWVVIDLGALNRDTERNLIESFKFS